MDASHKVAFAPEAEGDLQELYGFILRRSGDPGTAIGYVRRLREHCRRLCFFPERGTRRDDLAPGLRTMGFERRVTIVFAVRERSVEVLRIHYGGRNLDRSRP